MENSESRRASPLLIRCSVCYSISVYQKFAKKLLKFCEKILRRYEGSKGNFERIQEWRMPFISLS